MPSSEFGQYARFATPGSVPGEPAVVTCAACRTLPYFQPKKPLDPLSRGRRREQRLAGAGADWIQPLVPAKAGTQRDQQNPWIPAFAGMSGRAQRCYATEDCSCFVHADPLGLGHEWNVRLETPAGAAALRAGGRVGNRDRPRTPARPRRAFERLGALRAALAGRLRRRLARRTRVGPARLDGSQGLEELPPFKTSVTVDATAQDHHPVAMICPIFPSSTVRSIPTAGASMAASIASRTARRTPFWGCRPASISNPSCS